MHLKIYNSQFLQLLLILTLGILVQASTFAQKDILAKAEQLFEQELYADALSFYNQLSSIKDKDKSTHKIISLIETNQLIDAESILNELVKNDSTNPKLLFYRAYIFQNQGHFDLAFSTYKKVLKHAKQKDPIRLKARYFIKKCRVAQQMSNKTGLAFVENLGSEVNSKFNDFGAIQSPNFPGLIYYNSNRLQSETGKKNEANPQHVDMYSIKFINGSWSSIHSVDSSLNTYLNENICGFPQDGSSLIYIQEQSSGNKFLHINHFNSDSLQQSLPQRFNSKIKAELGDDFIQVFSDSIFVYSSLRREGAGGYDIFMITLENGKWQNPVHFGHRINSSYNEICPFLTSDGKQLFFSSDRPASIGGYDIFMSEYDETINKWSTPQNLAYPINSMKDDLYFRLDQNGNSANFSSDRIGGIGGLDLYIAYLKQENEHNISTTRAIPFLNDYLETIQVRSADSLKKEDIIVYEQKNQKESNLFILKPLFFNAQDRLIYGRQESYLKKLIRLLLDDTYLTLDIESHSAGNGDFSFQLYRSIKQTEDLVNYFVQHGVSKDRLLVKGYGSSFPLNTSFSQNRIDANKMNKRVSFSIKKENSTSSTFKDSKLARSMISPEHQDYKYSISNLSYSIEIAKTQQPYKNPALEELQPIMVEKITMFYHYSTGAFDHYAQAKSALDNMTNYNVQDLKIIAYSSGRRITKTNYSDQLKIYPDLANYIIDAYSKK